MLIAQPAAIITARGVSVSSPTTADAPWNRAESKRRHQTTSIFLMGDRGERVLAVDPVLAKVGLLDLRTGRTVPLYDDSRAAIARGPAPPDTQANERLRRLLATQKVSATERNAILGAVTRSQGELPAPSLVKRAVGLDARRRLWIVRRGVSDEPVRSTIEVVDGAAVAGGWTAGGRVFGMAVRGDLLALILELVDGPNEGEFQLELWRIRN